MCQHRRRQAREGRGMPLKVMLVAAAKRPAAAAAEGAHIKVFIPHSSVLLLFRESGNLLTVFQKYILYYYAA